jgi:hypothetical protein
VPATDEQVRALRRGLREWQSRSLDRQYAGPTPLVRVVEEGRARTLKDVIDFLDHLGFPPE